jgi:amidase
LRARPEAFNLSQTERRNMSTLTRRQALIATAAAAAVSACKPTGTAATRRAATEFLDGTDLAARIAAGETTALAETEAAIARATRINGDINAIATDSFADARADAAAALSGPFAGVPTFIKDLVDWRGTQTLFGSRAFKGNIAVSDSEFAATWRKAGVVVLGKSTSPEMGLISSTEPLVTGATRNPWDLSRTPGGSSGGAAALVAARIVPFAHASDGGGSIRIPASTCGVFGLKPSRGRLPAKTGGAPPAVDISVNHAVTISVRDAIGLFQIAEIASGPFAPLGKIEPLRRRLKIAYAPAPLAGTVLAPETAAALDEVAKLCEQLGHGVENVVLKMDGTKFADQFLLYWAAGAAEFAASASKFSGKPISPEIVEPWTLGLAQMFMQRRSEMPATIAYLQAFTQAYEGLFAGYDVLLTPVTGSPAVTIGEQAPDGDFDKVMANVLNFAAYTAPMNVAGAASMSVPLSWSPAGLPIGAMFSGRAGDDGLLFELALELEAARPWAGRLPPVCAFQSQ